MKHKYKEWEVEFKHWQELLIKWLLNFKTKEKIIKKPWMTMFDSKTKNTMPFLRKKFKYKKNLT